MILSAFRERQVSARLAKAMLSDAGRLSLGRRYRLAISPHNRLGPSGRMTADRFATRLNRRLVLRDLHGCINAGNRPVHRRRVADLLNRREGETQSAPDGLRLQYPGQAPPARFRRPN